MTEQKFRVEESTSQKEFTTVTLLRKDPETGNMVSASKYAYVFKKYGLTNCFVLLPNGKEINLGHHTGMCVGVCEAKRRFNEK